MVKSILIIGVILAIGVGIFLNTKKQGSFQNNSLKNENFSTSTVGLAPAKSPETVKLQNGETYTLSAGIVKKNINGKDVKMLAYNGSIPGPILTIPQGATVTINFKNNLDVPTTLHSHGIRDENKFDGVPDITQKEIPIGGEFTYKLKFPDAGAFWYHAHVREDYTQQLGLFGNYIVEPTEAQYYSSVNREIPLTVSDLLLKNGQAEPFRKNMITHTLMGRFGNTMLINGGTTYKLSVNQGDVVRFYLTNTANVRPFNLKIKGAKIKLVGGDNGKYEKEQFVSSLLISPSERIIVEVLFEKAGSYQLVNETPQKTYQLGTITALNKRSEFSYESAFSVLRVNSDVKNSIDPLREYFNKTIDKNLTLTMDMMNAQNSKSPAGGMSMPGHNMQMMGKTAPMNMGNESNSAPSDKNKIEWEDTMGMMNAMSDTNMVKWKLVDSDTQKENMNVNWKFNTGDVVKMKIFNDPNSQHPMQHPIHIHGQRFLVLATNGLAATDFVYKDSVLVQNGDTVELLIKMDNPGKWVIHCHIPEHMEAGMMSQFTVI